MTDIAGPKPRILFLDDEQPILNALKRSLRKENFELFFSTEPEEALQRLGSDNIDIVVSDHLMPHMTGIEFFTLASRLHPNIYRIILTGQADVNVAMKAINEGHVNLFLTKPWDDEELRNALLKASREIQIRKLTQNESQQEPTNDITEPENYEHKEPIASPSIHKDETGTIVLDDPDLNTQ